MSSNREKLAKLNEEVWDIRTDTLRGGKKFPFGVVKRKLTQEELQLVIDLANSHEFIVEPVNAGMGFNFGVIFHEPPQLPGMKPERVLSLEGHHLPAGMEEEFDGAWRVLSPLSHNQENGWLLKHFGFDRPREKSHYEY